MMREPDFPAAVISAARLHALEDYPNESVGFVMPDGYRPVANVHPDPTHSFVISDEDYLSAQDTLGLIHSHPVPNAFDRRLYKAGFGPDSPTREDMESQIASALPWGIILTDGVAAKDPFWFGDFVLNRPMIGRPFRHGAEDCYTAIRKWYWQERAVKLLEFPRDDNWWEGDAPLYTDGFGETGFHRISASDGLLPGDVGLIKVGGRVVKQTNHGFIFLGNSLIYHHLPGRLSRREPIGGRYNGSVIWLRHEGDHNV